MLRGIRKCLMCGCAITPSFWLCQDCMRELALEGVPYREWPAAVKALVLQHQRLRYREKRNLGRETDAAGVFIDIVSYGEFNDDGHGSRPWWKRPVRGGGGRKLVCLKCRTVFRDEWATWPLPYSQWEPPTCPTCGRGWFVDCET